MSSQRSNRSQSGRNQFFQNQPRSPPSSQFGGSRGGPAPRGGPPTLVDKTPMKEIEYEKAVDIVKRSWFGKNGRTCKLLVNYFQLGIRPNIKIFRYNVDILELPKVATESGDAKNPKAPETVRNRLTRQHVLWNFLKVKFQFKLSGFAYDDRDILYTTYDLFSDSGEDESVDDVITIKDPVRDDEFRYHVVIRSKNVAQLDLQTLNVILTAFCRRPFETPLVNRVQCEIDRRFIVSESGYQPYKIKDCLIMLRGLKSAIKRGPGGKFLANYDIQHSTFLEPKVGILHFYAMSKGIEPPTEEQIRAHSQLSLNDNQKREINALLHGMRVRTTYGSKRSYRYTKILDQSARQAMIAGKNQTVAEYFRQKHNIALKLPDMPLVCCGHVDRGICIPMELLQVDNSWQRLRTKLPDELQALTTAFTTTEPKRRFNHIVNMMRECQVYDDETADQFGLTVGKKMLEIEGRILGIPNVTQRLQRAQGFPSVLTNLTVVNVDQTVRNSQELEQKVDLLAEFCGSKGLKFECVSYGSLDTRRPLKLQLENLKGQAGQRSLILFILGDFDKQTYDHVKTICDLELGIRTQFLRRKTFLKIGPHGTLLSNLWRKMNNKVGGQNARVEPSNWSKFTNLNEPTLFVGIDVTHPAPGDQSANSVAALVANLDTEAVNYGATVRILPSRCERVDAVGEMLVAQISAFREKNKRLPAHIVVFRDGVSESQFDMVINDELASMKRACTKKLSTYKPTYTVVIVQKRHSTRFYAPQGGDPKNANVLPGTVVDRYITYEKVKEFFLCAHKGLLGTSRPIHCVVIHDEWNLSADETQHCTNVLCNLVGRASGPVSLPAPVQYAHLVCFRARSYINSHRNRRLTVPDERKTEAFDAHPEIRPFMYFS